MRLALAALLRLLELQFILQRTGLNRWSGAYLAENCGYKHSAKTRIFKLKRLNYYVEDNYERSGFLEGNT